MNSWPAPQIAARGAILMAIVVVDTDVVSFRFKKDTRARLYKRHLLGQQPLIAFMTLAELCA